MSKGRTTNQPIRTELITDKEKFKKVLAEQLEIGGKLFLKHVAPEAELAIIRFNWFS
jgi:hypothetical protein